MTNILNLQGEELDALVAEHVMGWKVSRRTRMGELGFTHKEQTEIKAEHFDGDRHIATHWIQPASWSGTVHHTQIFRPSREALGMEEVLDRMIELGYMPNLNYDGETWIVAMRNQFGDFVTHCSKDIKKAVCKAALLAVGV